MNIKPKQFLLIGGILSFSFFCIYILLFLFQLKSPEKAEYWINNTYHYKDFRAQNIKSKKIIIISGSNSLFGINSEKIEEITGYPVVNLAVHAGLDINYLYYKIKKYIKKDDIIIMPLELSIYTRSDQISGWFSNNMMTWGLNYLKQLSLIESFNFLITTEVNRVLQGVRSQLESNSTNKKILSKEEILTTLDKLWLEDGEKWRGYSYKSLNKFGDINADKAVIFNKEVAYLKNTSKLSSHFLNHYKKIEELAKQFNASLYLTYPVTIRNKLFDLSKKEAQERISLLETQLNKHNISIRCNPALFNLERVFFFNARTHTNKYGALIRSENLAHCINRLENNFYQKYSYNEAIKKTNILQEKYIDKVKHPDISFFEQRKIDLTKIKNALIKYKKDNGHYPISNSWGRWDKSGKTWIVNLSPKYIKQLPRDPRKTNDKTKQYLYKSNGKDYKLISHKPEDCKSVKDKHPNLIDPKRNCWAYGFWTNGAKNW